MHQNRVASLIIFVGINTSPGASIIVLPVAPGEGIIPTNIMRQLYFDAKCFPLLHPSGKFVVDHV